jgi:glycosyltransferase involved in cell wall biosynthesis
MLIFVHSFSLSSPGGGPRIFRALLQDTSQPWISVCSGSETPPKTQVGPEIHLPIRRNFGRIDRSRFGKYLYLFEKQGQQKFEQKLADFCRQNNATGIHGLAHSIDFWYAYRVAKTLGLPYYFTVHDDLRYVLKDQLSLGQGMACLSEVWNGSAARFVISEAMGEEYCRRYGRQPYIVATDGLTDSETVPLLRPERSLRVYFMGAVHLTYAENFRSLYAALQIFKQSRPDWEVSLTIRGGTGFKFEPSEVVVHLLPWASEEEVSQDLAQVDYLYLPLPFESGCEDFVRYSLSTKMVTYLGSGLPILYHGPAHAAAGSLLMDHQAAIALYSLSPEEIQQSIETEIPNRSEIVNHAIVLGQQQFSLPRIREKFWSNINQELVLQP